MWTKVKLISKHHPNEVVRQYAKHLLAKMNAGLKWQAKNEINFLIKKHYHEIANRIERVPLH